MGNPYRTIFVCRKDAEEHGSNPNTEWNSVEIRCEVCPRECPPLVYQWQPPSEDVEKYYEEVAMYQNKCVYCEKLFESKCKRDCVCQSCVDQFKAARDADLNALTERAEKAEAVVKVATLYINWHCDCGHPMDCSEMPACSEGLTCELRPLWLAVDKYRRK